MHRERPLLRCLAENVAYFFGRQNLCRGSREAGVAQHLRPYVNRGFTLIEILATRATWGYLYVYTGRKWSMDVRQEL